MANAKFLDLNGLKHFWESVRDTNGANIKLTGYAKGSDSTAVEATDTIIQAIAKLENQVADAVAGGVTSFGSQTGDITVDGAESSNGSVKFAMVGTKLTGSVDLSGKADKAHSHVIDDITDLDAGWDTLLKASPDVVTDAQLDTKADKTKAVGSFDTTEVSADGADVTVTIKPKSVSGAPLGEVPFNIPKATSGACGVITENRVTELASTLVSTLDGALLFKGTVGTGGDTETLPTTDYKVGWTYLVAEAGTYAGQVCEIGDMIVCKKSYATSASNSDWSVIQTNINGAVTTTGTLTTDQLVVGVTGTSVKTLAAGGDSEILKMVGGKPTWAAEYSYTLPEAGASLGGVKSGDVATIAGGVITAISKATNADNATNATNATTAATANKVANALTITPITKEGAVGTAVKFDGSTAVGLDAITFAEIDTVFA